MTETRRRKATPETLFERKRLREYKRGPHGLQLVHFWTLEAEECLLRVIKRALSNSRVDGDCAIITIPDIIVEILNSEELTHYEKEIEIAYLTGLAHSAPSVTEEQISINQS